MTKTLTLIGVGLALALPALGQTENVPFTVLAQTTSGSGPDAAQQVVIRTPAGMSVVDPWLSSPAPYVDWGREVLALASLGTKPTGGYAVEVAAVTRTPLGTTPNAFRYEVQVRESAPSGPAIQIQTQPFQVVKFRARPSDAVVFVGGPTVPPPAPLSFEAMELSVTAHMLSGPPSTRTISIQRDGAVQAVLNSGVPLTIDGRATPQELRALSRAVETARLRTIPAVTPTAGLGQPGLPGFPGSPWTLKVQSATPDYAGSTQGAEVGLYAQYQARLEPLIEGMQQVLDRLLNSNPPLPSPTISGEIDVQGSRVILRRPSGEQLAIEPPAIAARMRRFDGRYA
ncbi:MAG: protease complex subunit PrcB family protein, partial [Planctomycetes bacterium]|nr:protease complex subunit PrcB family protein [Planctomycetota bacterium]